MERAPEYKVRAMKVGKPVHQWQLSFEGEWPTAVTFLDDARIAAGNRGGDIFVWDLPQNPPAVDADTASKDKSKETRLPDVPPALGFRGHTNAISHLRTVNAGKTLVSSSFDHTVRLWNVDAKPVDTATVILDQSTRERTARYKSKEEKERILNAPGVSVPIVTEGDVLAGHKGWIQACDVTSDGSRLVSGDDTGLSIVRDLKTRKIISQWQGYDRVWVRSAAITPDGNTVFTCEFAGRRSNFDAPAAQARLWNATDGTLKQDLLKVWTPKFKDKDRRDTYQYLQTWNKILKRGLVCAAFSPDGKLLAVGQGGETDTGKVHLVEMDSGKILRSVSGHRYGVCDVKFSADGKYVVSSGRDTQVRICQTSDGKEVAVLGKERGGQFKDWVHAVAISPDQTRIAAADIAGFVHVWKLEV